jgi:hypothetical protein
MAKTYTEHKLTDAMLQRLSKLSRGRQCGGVSTFALESRGLLFDQNAGVRYAPEWMVTEAGRNALIKARREGW